MATLQRWFRWLDDRDGMKRHPLLVVWASLVASETGRPAEAERWVDLVDRWQYGDVTHPADPYVEGWAAVIRAGMCRHGVTQMRADADEGARKLAEVNVVSPLALVMQGMVRILGDDPEGGDAFLEDAVAAAEELGVPDGGAIALCDEGFVGDRAGSLRPAWQPRSATTSWLPWKTRTVTNVLSGVAKTAVRSILTGGASWASGQLQ